MLKRVTKTVMKSARPRLFVQRKATLRHVTQYHPDMRGYFVAWRSTNPKLTLKNSRRAPVVRHMAYLDEDEVSFGRYPMKLKMIEEDPYMNQIALPRRSKPAISKYMPKPVAPPSTKKLLAEPDPYNMGAA